MSNTIKSNNAYIYSSSKNKTIKYRNNNNQKYVNNYIKKNKSNNNKNEAKAKTKKNDEAKEGGELDEKGNPYPIENKNGGDPTCPGGYKIDYDFDVFDPINPPFRCISALIEPSVANEPSKIMEKLNNPASNVTGLAAKALNKPVGGRRYRSRRHTHTRTRTRTRTHRRMNVKRSRRRSHRSSV
jgi:hypothetical protein